MIVRDVDVYNLESFDFFNDAKDTFHWLCRMTRRAEALELHRKWMAYQHMEMADMAGCTACGGEGGATDFPAKEDWIAPDHEAAEAHRKQTDAECSGSRTCYLLGFPPIGERVTVTRQSGQTLTARIGIKLDAEFRDPKNLHWLTDDNKFADVEFDPIVSWSR
jgi:hypothetical protein